MKTIFLLMAAAISSFALNLNNPYKMYTETEARALYPDFKVITGESDAEFSRLIKSAVQDKDWQDGTNYISNSTKVVQIAAHDRLIPQWDKALISYRKSALDTGNILSAYEGMTIVTMFFTVIPSNNDNINNNIVIKNLDIFDDILIKKGYCYGYLSKSIMELDYKKDPKASYETALSGQELCKKQLESKKIPVWIEKELRKVTARSKYYLDKENQAKQKAQDGHSSK